MVKGLLSSSFAAVTVVGVEGEVRVETTNGGVTFTPVFDNPDSWEGWYWGAKHVWGQGFQGMMSPAANLIKDISEHCDMVLKWGCDEETTPWGLHS